MRFPMRSRWFKDRERLLFVIILLVGVAIRAYRLGTVPAGTNQDEAYTGYEAWSLLTYGVDSAGNPFPMYFSCWGSGANVLYSYLAIPFIKLFGLTLTAVRLPQFLFGCISLPAFYHLLRDAYSKRVALTGMFLLAISPWHIMLSRWGLESNIGPAFLLLGLTFFVKGLGNNRWFLLSALFLGGSLYGYAVLWLFVPLLVGAMGVYMLARRVRVKPLYVIGSLLLFAALALPPALFWLVNKLKLEPIHFLCFTIPRMAIWRGGEIAFENLFRFQSYYDVLNGLAYQWDDLISNTPQGIHIYYALSIPFGIVGTVALWDGLRREKEPITRASHAFIAIGVAAALVTSLLVSNRNVNRVNCLHPYVLLLAALGVDRVCQLCSGEKRVLAKGIFLAYALCFVHFTSYYFTDYTQACQVSFKGDFQQALSFAQSVARDKICLDSEYARYPHLLFWEQISASDLAETAAYAEAAPPYATPLGFTRYQIGMPEGELDPDVVYIVLLSKAEDMEKHGFTAHDFEWCSVAYRDAGAPGLPPVAQ